MTANEFADVIDRVRVRSGDEWAEWVAGYGSALIYGPEYRRSVADTVGNVLYSLRSGDGFAEYWRAEADRLMDRVGGVA